MSGRHSNISRQSTVKPTFNRQDETRKSNACVSVTTIGRRFDIFPQVAEPHLRLLIDEAAPSGFTLVSKIEADDGRWEGEGMKDGQKMKFHADAKTGEIIDARPDR
ncbi:PepSY domain-containing protein [Bradyrhizobium daqingense]|uniref:PepSY domain-containing protein n=1 Tax=Bradyrhizobium daqingense TaxID=993502 RepID=UPI0032214D9D